MARLLQYTFNATVQVADNNTNGLPNTTYVSDGQDWANFVNRIDASSVSEQGPVLEPGTTTVVQLPVGATQGVAIAWSFNQPVTMQFDYGSIVDTKYGILQGDYLTLSIIVDPAFTTPVTGHIVLLGA